MTTPIVLVFETEAMTRQPMRPYERLCYWVAEREQIRNRNEAGQSAPWTADPILETYRFTNVRRRDDRVSRLFASAIPRGSLPIEVFKLRQGTI